MVAYPLVDGTVAIAYQYDSPIIGRVPGSITIDWHDWTVSTIMANGIKNKSYLTRVIPDTITTIGVNAFEDTKFSSNSTGAIPLIIPSSVKYIGNSAFKNVGLTSITFDNLANVRYIGDYAFCYNELIDEPDLSIVPYVGDDVYTQFGNISGTFYRYANDTRGRSLNKYEFDKATRTYTWMQKKINNSGEWDGNWELKTEKSYTPGKQITLATTCLSFSCDETVAVIDNTNIDDSYYQLTEEPTIEDGVLYMDTVSRGLSIAFTVGYEEINMIPSEYNSKSIEAILKNGITYYGIETVTLVIPKSIKFIGSNGLQGGGVTNVEFEEGTEIETLDRNALSDTRITSIEIPNTVKTIKTSALNVTTLTSVTFAPDSIIETLGANLFGSYVTSFTIPKSVKNIASTFNFAKMKNVYVEEGSPYFKVENSLLLSKDGKEVWHGNADHSSTDVVIPEGVEIIHSQAFIDGGMTSLSLPSTLKVIESQAFQQNSFSSITIPASLTTIGESAFYNPPGSMPQITSLIFEENSHLEYIGRYAFTGANISNLVLPESVITYTDAFTN
jgi:hypothetical protein